MMNKNILIKQYEHNKRKTEKKIALVLAGGLITCALGTEAVSAAEIKNMDNNVVTENKGPIMEPEIIQHLEFDKNNPTDLVIKGINFNGESLKEFKIAENSCELSKLIIGDNTITIPKEVVESLNLSVGSYSVYLEFSDGSISVGGAWINVIDKNATVPPTNNGNDKPENKPDEEVKPDTSNPTIAKQTLKYNLDAASDLVVKDVNFDNGTLDFIILNGNAISSKELTIDKDKGTITIPETILKKSTLAPGVYSVTFKFKNNVVLKDEVYLKVESTSEVVFDKNKPQSIEVTDFIVSTQSKIDYVTINGIKFEVIYMDNEEIALLDAVPKVYMVNNKLVIPVDVIEYIGVDTSNYVIEAALNDGTTISKVVNVNVVDSSDKDKDNTPIVPPSEDDKDKDNTPIVPPASDDKDKDTTPIVPPASDDKNNIGVDNLDKKDVSTKGENTDVTNTVEKFSETPKTGAAQSAGLFTTLMAAAAGLGFTRKKK